MSRHFIWALPSIFRRAGEFPAAEAMEVPLSDEAAQFYKAGRPFLQNYLPFWMASLVAKLLVLLIPIVGVIYPLLRFVPAIYGWSMRRKTSRFHEELRFLEDELEAGLAAQDAASAHLPASTGLNNRRTTCAFRPDMQAWSTCCDITSL